MTKVIIPADQKKAMDDISDSFRDLNESLDKKAEERRMYYANVHANNPDETYLQYALQDRWQVETEAIPLVLNMHPLSLQYGHISTKLAKLIRSMILRAKPEALKVETEGRFPKKHYVDASEYLIWLESKEVPELQIPSGLLHAVVHKNQGVEHTKFPYWTPELLAAKEVMEKHWVPFQNGEANQPKDEWLFDIMSEAVTRHGGDGKSSSRVKALLRIIKPPEYRGGGPSRSKG